MTTFLAHRLGHCLITAALALIPLAANAGVYPDKTVRIILPYAAGGSTDIVARKLAQQLSSSLGQTFFVENKPGASGNIGTELVTRSAPDGYTLLLIPDSNITVNPHLYTRMKFDPRTALAPISLLAKIDVGLVVNSQQPVNSIPELIAYVKAKPNGLSFGSPGTGTPHHLAGELLKQLTGAQLVHIPYKGGAPAVTDLVGNQIPAAFVALAAAGPHIKSGKLRLLGVTQSTRSKNFPDTPTIGESIKGFDVTSWMGLFAPAGTPPEIIQTLSAEVKKALLDDATAKTLAAQSLEVVASSPEELNNRMQKEYERWGVFIKNNHISLNQ